MLLAVAVQRFAPIEPHETGMLDVGDGQQIYWEARGCPGNGTSLCQAIAVREETESLIMVR